MEIICKAYKYLVLFGISIALTYCSVEKNTGSTRFYQGMTAKYNIYFNGYESYKAGLAKISKNYRDDYAELLRVYESSDPSTVSMCSGDMERAIQKASKLISLKSITARPQIKDAAEISEKDKKLLDMKEYNKWVDDSYLLIGKARFFKHEFSEAATVLNYCITDANDPQIKLEAAVWLARINNETGNYKESLRLITELGDLNTLPKYIRSMCQTTMADNYIKQKKFGEAIDPLVKSVELQSGKRNRYRLTYLLAQLYEKTGNSAMATSTYRKVVNMNPPYDVEFNARINIAGVFDVNSGNPEEIKRELTRMMNDTKNKDYQDQIYYALGNLSMKEGKEKEAVDFFRKAASATSLNSNQKGRSYLALADHFYDKPDYIKAGTFYDSAVYFLDQKYPDYKAIKLKSQNLNSLVSLLVVIQKEDSLQRVALMPEQQRNALIATIIDKAVKERTANARDGNTDRYNLGQYYENERRFQGNIDQEGKWYFYNQTALTFGRSEFRRRWGDRKLEDNWRRANKTRVATAQVSGGPSENGAGPVDTTLAENDFKKPQFYLKNLPLNDSLIKVSNEKIATSLLSAGKAYAERISDTTRAIETLESLIARYPTDQLVPEALYSLYRITKDINKIKAETYRQRLLQKYPDNEFSKILSDPGYYEKKMAEIRQAGNIYNDAYTAFTSENFVSAITICNDALKKFPQDQLVPKFMLLKAYSVARSSDEKSFRSELSNIVKLWPGTQEGMKASELISYLDKKTPELKIEEDKKIATEIFDADTTGISYFAVVIEDPGFNVNQASFDVISYNIDNYTNKNYKTESSMPDNKYVLITVSGFPDFHAATEYLNSFTLAKVIRNQRNAKMMSFVITAGNLKVLKEDKNPGRYQLYFRDHFK